MEAVLRLHLLASFLQSRSLLLSNVCRGHMSMLSGVRQVRGREAAVLAQGVSQRRKSSLCHIFHLPLLPCDVRF
eukprot:2224834-Rhodomonas_salina.5